MYCMMFHNLCTVFHTYISTNVALMLAVWRTIESRCQFPGDSRKFSDTRVVPTLLDFTKFAKYY